MNYPPLMQQLPPMPMGSNYPSGPHEAASVQSGGPPNQYSPVMHGIPQSVSQGNYMLQSNAAAPPTLPTNNNLCNDFVSKPPQRCSNMAMVQGGCINTNMNSMHQTAPNYSNMNGATGANYMNGGEMYGGYQAMPQQINALPLRQTNVSAGYGGNVPQQPTMHPSHPHNGLNQHFSSIHRKNVPPNYNPYTMQSQGMNASSGYPMAANRPPNLQQQQQRHFMMQQQPQMIMQQKSGNLNTMGGFKGVPAGNGMDSISGMSQSPYNMNCSAPKPSNSQIMRLPSSNSPSYSVNNIPHELQQNSNKSLSGVVNLNAMQPPPQPQNPAAFSGFAGSRNLQLQQESQSMSMVSKGDAGFPNKVGLNSLVCSPPVSAPANNNNDVAFRNQQNSLSPGFCLSPNPKIVSPNVSSHSQLLASPCMQNNAAANPSLSRDQSVRSVPAMATSPFSPSSSRKRNNSNGAASPAHTDSMVCEAKIQKTMSLTPNTDSSLNGVKTPQASSDTSGGPEPENSELRQKFDDLVIEIVCRTPACTTPSYSDKTEGIEMGLEEALNMKSLLKNNVNGLVPTGCKSPPTYLANLSTNDKSLSKLIEDLQIDKLEKLPELKDDHLDDINMITSKRLPSCNVQEKTSANANPSFVPS